MADPVTVLAFLATLTPLLAVAAAVNHHLLRRILARDPGPTAERARAAHREVVRLSIAPVLAYACALAAPFASSGLPAWTTPMEALVAVLGGLATALVAFPSLARMAIHFGAVGSPRGIRRMLAYLVAAPAMPLLSGLLAADGVLRLAGPDLTLVPTVLAIGTAVAGVLLFLRGDALLRPLFGAGESPVPADLQARVDATVREGAVPPIRVWGKPEDGLPPFAFAIGGRHPLAVATPSLLPLLPPEELAAILEHEVGHVALGHGTRRMRALFGALGVVVGILWAAGWANGATCSVAWALAILYGLSPVARRCEAEADLYSADRMGSAAPPTAALLRFAPALLLDVEKRPASPAAAHPTIRERVEALSRWPADRTLPRVWPAYARGVFHSTAVCAAIAIFTVPASSARLDPFLGLFGAPLALLLSFASRTFAGRTRRDPISAGTDS